MRADKNEQGYYGGDMKISRWGAARNMGESSISLEKISISWSAIDGLAHIMCNNVADFTTLSLHNYDITLSLEELKKVLSAVLKAIPMPTTQY